MHDYIHVAQCSKHFYKDYEIWTHHLFPNCHISPNPDFISITYRCLIASILSNNIALMVLKFFFFLFAYLQSWEL